MESLSVGDLHFYMRHSFKPAPPLQAVAEQLQKQAMKTPFQDPDAIADIQKLQPNGHKHEANGRETKKESVNDGSSQDSFKRPMWQAMAEEALRKLHTPGAAPVHRCPSPLSVRGLSRSASFASIDSQGILDSAGGMQISKV